MGPGQERHLAGDRSNIGGTTAIGPLPILQNRFSNLGILQLMEHQLDMPLAILIILFFQSLHGLSQDFIKPLLAGRLVGNKDGLADRRGGQIPHRVSQ